MTRKGAAAQNYALARVGTRITRGQCLKNVRTWFGIPLMYGTAAEAWDGAVYKHPGARPPKGLVVPGWFHSANPAGHVALILADGSVVTVNGTTVSHFPSIEAVELAGFGKYMGYADDLNKVRVATTPKPKPKPKPVSRAVVLRKGSSGKRVKALQQGLNRTFPDYSHLSTDGLFGPRTDAVVRAFQSRAGLHVDGVVGPKTTAKLAAFGVTF